MRLIGTLDCRQQRCNHWFVRLARQNAGMACKRHCKALLELLTWHLKNSELLQMVRRKLRIEQLETTCSQPRDKMHQRNL
jgi:hypothetical protein